jgi:hypothetical protein
MGPVGNGDLSTWPVPNGSGSTRPFATVFPVVHTPTTSTKDFKR